MPWNRNIKANISTPYKNTFESLIKLTQYLKKLFLFLTEQVYNRDLLVDVTSVVSGSLGRIFKSILSQGRSKEAPDYNLARKQAEKIFHVDCLFFSLQKKNLISLI